MAAKDLMWEAAGSMTVLRAGRRKEVLAEIQMDARFIRVLR